MRSTSTDAVLLGLALGLAGCDSSTPAHRGAEACVECRLVASPPAWASYGYERQDVEAITTGVWEGHHPGGHGLPPFDIRVTVTRRPDVEGGFGDPDDGPHDDCDTGPDARAFCTMMVVRSTVDVETSVPGLGAQIDPVTVYGSVLADPDPAELAEGAVSTGVPLAEFQGSAAGYFWIEFGRDGRFWVRADDNESASPDEPKPPFVEVGRRVSGP
jgi:hypothetical protein